MGEITHGTLENVNKLGMFVSSLKIESKKQRIFAVIATFMTLILLIMAVEIKSTISSPMFVAVMVFAVFLILLSVALDSVEKSLSDFRSLIISCTSPMSDGGCKVTGEELNQLKQFVRQSRRFIIAYYLTKLLNYLVFILSGTSIILESMILFNLI